MSTIFGMALLAVSVAAGFLAGVFVFLGDLRSAASVGAVVAVCFAGGIYLLRSIS